MWGMPYAEYLSNPPDSRQDNLPGTVADRLRALLVGILHIEQNMLVRMPLIVYDKSRHCIPFVSASMPVLP